MEEAGFRETTRTTRRLTGNRPDPSAMALAAVGLAIGFVLLVDLLDLRTRPRDTLPAAFYCPPILIAAYYLAPRNVALVSIAAVIAQSMVGFAHESPIWPTGIEVLELALIGTLSVILSARIRREARLKAEAEINLLQFRGVVEGMIEGVILFSMDNTVIAMNPPALKMYRLGGEDEAIGRSLDEIGRGVHLRDASGHPIADGEQPVSRVLRGEILSNQEVDLLGLDDGSVVTALYNGRLIHNRAGGGKIGLLTIRDVTHWRNTQAQLLEQERELAAMAERGKLARELHDNLGDVLSYVVAEGLAVRTLMSKGEIAMAGEYLDRAIAASSGAIADMREYVGGLKLKTASISLLSAVRELLARLEASQGTRTQLIVAPGLREDMIGGADRFQLLRIAQEALANVRKHAAANSVKVKLRREFDHIYMEIEDDGRGFELNEVSPERQTFGIAVMMERAEERGGSLQVSSAPGHGTRVVVRLPLAIRKEPGQEQPQLDSRGYRTHEDTHSG